MSNIFDDDEEYINYPSYAYQNSIEMVYTAGGTTIEIESQFIRYIMIENLYEQHVMPVLYVGAAIPSDLYTQMIQHEKDGFIVLTINRKNAYSSTSLLQKDISGRFIYTLNSSDPNFVKDLDYDPQSDNSYKIITMALFNVNLLNKSKESFNGVLNDVDMSTLMYLAMSDIDKVVIKGPKYNPTFETEIIPALNSKKKMIQYLFNQSPFYDTKYTFFMDFDRSYLIDQTGEGCAVNDGTLLDVIFDIQEITSDEAYYEGMMTRDNAYYIYVNPAKTKVTLNKGQDKVANQLINVDEFGSVTMSNLNINRYANSTVKQHFQRGENATLKKNILESNSVFIEIEKSRLNGTIFTPNKRYKIKNYKDYDDYDGDYVLIYKNEIIANNGGLFNSSVQFGLKKIGNIDSIGTAASTTATTNTTNPYSYNNYSPTYTDAANIVDKHVASSSYQGLGINTTPKENSTTTSGDSLASSNIQNKRPINLAFAGPVKKLEAKLPSENLQRVFNQQINSKTIVTKNGETEE